LYKFSADTNTVNGTVQFFTDNNGDDLQASLTFNGTNLPEKVNVVFTADEDCVVTGYDYAFEDGNGEAGEGGYEDFTATKEYTLTLTKEEILAKGAGTWTFSGDFEQDEDKEADQYTISAETVTGGTITLYDGSKLTKDAETEDDVKGLTEIKSGTTFAAADLPTRIVALYKPESDAWGVEKATVKVDGEELTDVTISGFVSAFLDNSAKCLNLTFDEDDAGTYTFTGEFMKLEDVTILYRFSADTRYNSTASEGGTITFSPNSDETDASYTDVEDTLDGMEDIKVYFTPAEGYKFDYAYVLAPGAETYVQVSADQYAQDSDVYVVTIKADSEYLKIDSADKAATYQWIFTADFDKKDGDEGTGAYTISNDTDFVNCKVRFGNDQTHKLSFDISSDEDVVSATIIPYAGFAIDTVTLNYSVEGESSGSGSTEDITSYFKTDSTDFGSASLPASLFAEEGNYTIKVTLKRTALG
jgi:hypothetical protein